MPEINDYINKIATKKKELDPIKKQFDLAEDKNCKKDTQKKPIIPETIQKQINQIEQEIHKARKAKRKKIREYFNLKEKVLLKNKNREERITDLQKIIRDWKES